MDNKEQIAELQRLASAPELKNSFASQDDCIAWINKVGKLVNYNHYFYQCFSEQADLINTVGLSANLCTTALNKILTLINKVITDLEAGYPKPENDTNNINTPLLPPQKVTLKWLWEYVPAHYLWLLILLLAFFFGLGITFSQTKLYKSLTEKATAAINKNNTAPAKE